VEVGEILDSPRELALLKMIQHEDNLENLKTLIVYKGAKLNNSNHEEVQAFNALLRKFDEVRMPWILKEREDFVEKKRKELESLSNLDLSKLKFGRSTKIEKLFKEMNKKSGTDKTIKII
jgi:hypothetical protein